jgi:hypothetical protein
MHRAQGARHLRSVKNKARQRRQDAPREMSTTKFVTMLKQYMQN